MLFLVRILPDWDIEFDHLQGYVELTTIDRYEYYAVNRASGARAFEGFFCLPGCPATSEAWVVWLVVPDNAGHPCITRRPDIEAIAKSGKAAPVALHPVAAVKYLKRVDIVQT